MREMRMKRDLQQTIEHGIKAARFGVDGTGSDRFRCFGEIPNNCLPAPYSHLTASPRTGSTTVAGYPRAVELTLYPSVFVRCVPAVQTGVTLNERHPAPTGRPHRTKYADLISSSKDRIARQSACLGRASRSVPEGLVQL